MEQNAEKSNASIANHGLVLGKFMPLTTGHCHLIEAAQRASKNLTILVCSLLNEPINGHLRYEWVRDTFPDANVIHVTDEVPSFPHQHPDFWLIWRDLVRRYAPNVDALFTSEDYGETLARVLGIAHVEVDKARVTVPVSATQVRQNPLGNWPFIPPTVRPYFVKRVLVYGPESTGKTTLCRQLAQQFQTVWVPEFARGFYDLKGIKNACYEDVERIAFGQQESEERLARDANRLLFCDTDAITTTIYSRHYYGKTPLLLSRLANQRRYDLVLFTDIDLRWESDPQRDLGHRREEYREIFAQELGSRRIPFVTIRGTGSARLQAAIDAVIENLGVMFNEP